MTVLSMPKPDKSRRWILACTCLIPLLWYGEAEAAEEYVVIQAQPQTDLLAAGKKFSVGDLITIPKDTVVTLLGEDGSLTKITGPLTITVTPDSIEKTTPNDLTSRKAVGALSRISAFLLNSQSSVSTFGGARSVLGVLSDPWAIPIDSNTLGCYRDGVIGLHRSDARNQATISVRFGDQSDNYRFLLKPNQTVAYLPPDFSGGRVMDTLNVEGDKGAIKLVELPKSIDSSDGLQVLSWMIEIGCLEQAHSLVIQLATNAKDMN